MRQLASIQVITEVSPIEGADKIESVSILGWKCVAKKAEFKVGDLVCYFEIDSIIPEEILKKANLWDSIKNKGMLGRKSGQVLTTRRFRGSISQGLVLPLKELPLKEVRITEGLDLTEILKIEKYEKFVEVEFHPKASWQQKLIRKLKPILSILSTFFPWFEKFIETSGPFPHFIPKTDQTRIQNLTKEWGELSELTYEITEKVEGTSSTYFYYNKDVGMCSRNLRLSNFTDNHFEIVQKKYNIFKKLRSYNKNIAIQGEIVGPSIQGNYYNLPEHELKIFDIFLIDEQRYALPHERTDIINDLGLISSHAPIIDACFCPMGKTIDEILLLADKKSEINLKFNREGIVFKGRATQTSFKAISNSYLLNQKD